MPRSVSDGWQKVIMRHFGEGPNEYRLACGYHPKPETRYGYRRRAIEAYVLVYVLRGSGWFTGADGQRRRVSAGDVLQHQAGYPHSLEPDGDRQWWEFWFDLPASLTKSLSDLGLLRAEAVLSVGLSPRLRMLCDRLLAAVEGHPNTDTAGDGAGRDSVAAVVELTLALHGAAGLKGQRPRGEAEAVELERRLETARRGLDADPVSTESIPELAERVGLAYEAFRKGFRRRFGVSPHAYRIRRRLELGHHLLTREGLSVTEAAERLGYPDAFCFSKQYKRVWGVPPSAAGRGQSDQSV